jgi:hypothetical protein
MSYQNLIGTCGVDILPSLAFHEESLLSSLPNSVLVTSWIRCVAYESKLMINKVFNVSWDDSYPHLLVPPPPLPPRLPVC